MILYNGEMIVYFYADIKAHPQNTQSHDPAQLKLIQVLSAKN